MQGLTGLKATALICGLMVAALFVVAENKGANTASFQSEAQNLIKNLLGDDVKTSNEAFVLLKNKGITVEPILAKTMSETEDPDKQQKIKNILDYLGYISDKELNQLKLEIFNVINQSKTPEDATMLIKRILNTFHDNHHPFATRTYRSQDGKVLIVIGRNGETGENGQDAQAIDMKSQLVIALGGMGGVRISNESGRSGRADAYTEQGIAIALGGRGGNGATDGSGALMGGAGGGQGNAESPIASFSFGGEGGKGASSGGVVAGNGGKGGGKGVQGWENVNDWLKKIK